MKAKCMKSLITLLTLLSCMIVLYTPAFAEEVELDVDAETVVEHELMDEQDTPPELDDLIDFEAVFGEVDLGALIGSIFEVFGEMDFDIQPGFGGATTGRPFDPDMEPPFGTGFRPFTPPGQGTVVDNATDSDGKEFYTISTVEGDIFYLIIDRQRNSNNVYFLNAVTELDLIALARLHEREIPEGTVTQPLPNAPQSNGTRPPDEPPDDEEPDEPERSGYTMYIVLGVAFLGAIGAAYYVKIVKGKKNTAHDMDDDFDDEDSDDDSSDDDNDYDYGYEPESDDTMESDEDDEIGGERE